MTPYDQGRSAAAHDIRELCCPYALGSTERAEWLAGYRDQLAAELIERPVLR